MKSPTDTNTLGPDGQNDIPELETFFALLRGLPARWTIDDKLTIRTVNGFDPLCYLASCLGKNPESVKTGAYRTNLWITWKLRNQIELAAGGFLAPCCEALHFRLMRELRPKILKGKLDV